MGVHDVQRSLGLSSPSLASYHIDKLLGAGLVKRQDEGYVVDRIVFENIVRIKRTLIPFETTYMIFFIAAFLILLTYLKPPDITSTYVFALAVSLVGAIISLYEMVKAFRKV